MFVVEGRPAPGVDVETAKKAIWQELENLKEEAIDDRELQNNQALFPS